ncbi:hypothetical protein AS188_07420 [Kocuria flava]|uniref:Aminoglycoside phosphotransferase domain-containing protein n=1 Tax=Kocuria flava TaxID=446860 RepID=A0A0U3HEL4_9MICC|nr:aminoglycoside phosphotransferase family protein [Kocuria flava]ALU39609.1 hypothetical protein AS188_07420 [Kocuria flava]GEO91393.1 hypothetical protein KFL01_06990 [Kocuria flava]
MDELERIAAAFPDLRWDRARRITEGWDHVVVVLDDALVFRFPQEEPYVQSLAREVAVLEHLAPRLPVRVPRYDRTAPDGSFAGYPLLPGRTLQPEVLAALDAPARAAVVDQLAGFLSGLHTAPVAGTPLERLAPVSLPEDQREVRAAAAAHLPAVLSRQELADAEAMLAAVDALLAERLPAVPVHNDVYSRHLLWDDDAAALAVLDFSDMGLGDPAVDFAELHEYGQEFVRAVHARYTGPKDPGFLERSWTYQCWVGVYMLTDHFDVGKTSWAIARETFDRVRRGR